MPKKATNDIDECITTLSDGNEITSTLLKKLDTFVARLNASATSIDDASARSLLRIHNAAVKALKQYDITKENFKKERKMLVDIASMSFRLISSPSTSTLLSLKPVVLDKAQIVLITRLCDNDEVSF